MEHPYIQSLIENCEIAKRTNPVNTYRILTIAELELLPVIGNSIYVIREIGGNKDLTFSNFTEYKSFKKRACARLNNPSNILYVGSSTSGVKKRIMQHINEGPKKTYALHMKNWFKGMYEVEINEYTVPIEVIQIIEDSISFNLKPAFGKQGGNNT